MAPGILPTATISNIIYNRCRVVPTINGKIQIANRRARTVGLEEPFPGAKNVSPWMDEQATLRKEKNFFETRVIEYQAGPRHEW